MTEHSFSPSTGAFYCFNLYSIRYFNSVVLYHILQVLRSAESGFESVVVCSAISSWLQTTLRVNLQSFHIFIPLKWFCPMRTEYDFFAGLSSCRRSLSFTKPLYRCRFRKMGDATVVNLCLIDAWSPAHAIFKMMAGRAAEGRGICWRIVLFCITVFIKALSPVNVSRHDRTFLCKSLLKGKSSMRNWLKIYWPSKKKNPLAPIIN